MEYSSTISIPSKVYEGVTFTILRMQWARRRELRRIQAPARERMQSLQKEMAPLSKAYSEAMAAAKAAVKPERDRRIAEGATPEEATAAVPLGTVAFDGTQLDRLMELSAAIDDIDRAELTREAVKFVLVGIEGLAIDGEPATVDLLQERGPDKLYAEIAEAVARELGLLPEEQENLGSPSTSAGVVDGSATPGTAEHAGKLVTITSAAAPSSTDPASATVTDTA
jgi:hypothetical protein